MTKSPTCRVVSFLLGNYGKLVLFFYFSWLQDHYTSFSSPMHVWISMLHFPYTVKILYRYLNFFICLMMTSPIFNLHLGFFSCWLPYFLSSYSWYKFLFSPSFTTLSRGFCSFLCQPLTQCHLHILHCYGYAHW